MSAGGISCNDWGSAFFTRQVNMAKKHADKLKRVTDLAICLAVVIRQRRLFRRWRKAAATRMRERSVVLKMNRKVLFPVIPWMGRLVYLRKKWERVRAVHLKYLWEAWKYSKIKWRRERKIVIGIILSWDDAYRAQLFERVFGIGIREKTKYAIGVWKKEFHRVRSSGRRVEAMIPKHSLQQHFNCLKVLLRACRCDNKLMQVTHHCQ